MTEKRILCMNVNGSKAMVSRPRLPTLDGFHLWLKLVPTKITKDSLTTMWQLVSRDSTVISFMVDRSWQRGQTFAMSHPEVRQGGLELTFCQPSVLVGSGPRVG